MDRLFLITELLVIRSRAGDRAAYARLAELWEPRLRAHAERLCAGFGGAGRGWAADAAQEAWVSIARGIGGLDDPRAFGAWAERIVARRVADAVRRAQRERGRDRRGAERMSEADGGGADDAGGRAARLRVALAAARPDDRALLGMVYGRGRSVGAAAEAFSVAEGTIKSRLARARDRLRNDMERMR